MTILKIHDNYFEGITEGGIRIELPKSKSWVQYDERFNIIPND